MTLNKLTPMHRTSPNTLRQLTLLASVGSLLVSCTTLAPPYETPTFLVSSQYAPTDSDQSTNAASIGWRDYFTEPALQALIEMALANNLDLRIATFRVAEARAGYAIQRSDGLPKVAAQAGLERAQTPEGLSPTGRSVVGNQAQLSVGLATWEIDFWGAVRSRNEAALQRYLATDAARRSVTLLLIAQVADTYLGLRELDERIAIANQATTTRSESVRIFTRRVEVGSSSRLTLTEAQTLLTQAQALGSQLHQARDTLAQQLTLLVGAPVSLQPAKDALDPLHGAPTLRAGLPSDLLLNRPDIADAEHRLKANYADIGAARADFFPRVSLTGALGVASPELGSLFDTGSKTWSYAPRITLPIFDGGSRTANLEATIVRRDAAVAAYAQTVQNAFRDVADALSNGHWLREQLQIAQAALVAQTERARLSQLRFENGASSFILVLDAQRDLFTVQQQAVQARRAVLSNQVALYSALGGGSLTLSGPDTPAASGQ